MSWAKPYDQFDGMTRSERDAHVARLREAWWTHCMRPCPKPDPARTREEMELRDTYRESEYWNMRVTWDEEFGR